MRTQTIRERLLASTMIGGVALVAMIAAPAMAQEEPEASEVDEIVVTGSRIVRSDVNSANPITIRTGESLRETGIISLGEALKKDPSISGDGGFGQSSILSGGGSTTVDLRNLGPDRSLILINGKRFSTFADSLQNGASDLSFLPTGMLERVEILRDGAGPTYGADAVAGVVNFILREDFNGAEVGGFYGISQQGDAIQYRANTVIGASTDRGSVMFGLEYSHRDELEQESRPFAMDVITGFTGAGVPFIGSSAAPGARLLNATTGALVRCYNNTGGAVAAGGACPRYDYGFDQSLIGGQDTVNISGHAEYELSDAVSLTTSFVYANRESEFNLSANPIFGGQATGPYPNGLIVPATSPNNPFGQAVTLQWRPVQVGTRHQKAQGDQLWADVALEGRSDLFGGLFWNLSHTYSKTNGATTSENIPWATHLQRLLDPALCAADPVCRTLPSGPIPNIDNLFSGVTPMTADQRRYAFYTQGTSSSFETRQTQFNVSGDLFALPAGDVAYAFGIEQREESGRAVPDAVAASGESIANGTNPTQGKFDVNEVYGEVEIPLLADVPFFQELTLNVQGRYSVFSNFGEADVYKVGLNWAVNDDLRFRATKGTSFRAPNIGDLFGGGVESFQAITDPCANTEAPTTNAQLRSNCDALGRPALFNQAAPQIRVLSGGNPNLLPEEGDSYTLGIILTPRWIPNLALTVDYYSITLTNGIAGGLLQTRLNNCYLSPTFLADRNNPGSDCFRLDQRTTTFNLPVLSNGPRNDPTRGDARGIDWTARYRFDDFMGGRLGFNWSNSHVFEDTNYGKDIGFIFDSNGSISSPEWRSVLDVEYSRDNWSVAWTTEYSSAMSDFRVANNFGGFGSNTIGYSGTDDYYLHSLRLRHNWDTLGVTLGINNVFDEDPPYVFATANNLSSLHDFVGRYFFVAVNKSF